MLSNPLEREQLLQQLGGRQPDGKELDRLAVGKLIHRRLILQEATRRKLSVTERELDEHITSLRRRFKDLGSFGAWMGEQGLDDDSLFETIRTEMLAARVRAALVEGARVTDDHAQRYYDAHKEELRIEEVRLQIIVVKEKEEAEEIMAALGRHDDFGRLARQRSLGQRAAQGGDTGWIDVETLSPPLREVVATLEPRDARGPLPRRAEFLVVRLGERRPGRTKSLAEARAEIERRLLPAMQQEAMRTWLTEQEKRAKIEVFPQASSRVAPVPSARRPAES
jgi:peptidyl-prolyl cis-trans isomerase SurA